MAKKSLAAPIEWNETELFDKKAIESLEKAFNGTGHIAVARRVTLAVMRMTKSRMQKLWAESDESRESMFAMLNEVGKFHQATEEILKIAKAAFARITITGEECSAVHEGTPT